MQSRGALARPAMNKSGKGWHELRYTNLQPLARRPQARGLRQAKSEPTPRRKVSANVPRLYLVAPLADDRQSVADLSAALEAADIAAVLVQLPQAGAGSLAARLKAVAPPVQGRGAALLLDGHPDLVAPTAADGAHLTGIKALKSAVGLLKPGRIAGAGGLRTRHDAMVAGEAGADYVMFGEPDAGGRRPPFGAIVERVAWWAELFEPPCVGYAMDLDEVEALAGAGADFVAVGRFIFADGKPAAAVRAAAGRLVRA